MLCPQAMPFFSKVVHCSLPSCFKMKLRILKGSRICYSQMCHFGKITFLSWRQMNWRQLRTDTGRVFYLPLICLKQMFLNMFPNSGSTACCSEADTWETIVDWKGKVALFRRLATWGEAELMCKNQFLRFWEKKRSWRQRKKGEIYPFECRVPKNSKERYESLHQWWVQRSRRQQ